jgi:hypothetical protein
LSWTMSLRRACGGEAYDSNCRDSERISQMRYCLFMISSPLM